MSERSYESDFTYSSKSSKKDPDLKNQLLQMLKAKGVVDKLKTQVRQKLISEIAAKESIINLKGKSQDKIIKDIDVFVHASLSVIYEYLNKEDFQYTKSVFTPESGIVVNKFYSTDEMLRILQLDTKSEFYKKMKISLADANSNFLVCLLKTISEYHNSKQTQIDAPTEKHQRPIPLSEKMENLEMQFENRQKQGILKTQQLYEDRIISFQRDIEKRLRQEMENEMQRFKDHEISLIKLQENDHYNKLLKDKSHVMEEEYKNRLTALKERERVSQEDFQRYKESQDRENYLQRQQLLRDINNIQERELQNKKERERIEREFSMMKEQHKMKMDHLDERNSRLKELELGIDLRINQEVNSFKLDEEKRLVHKWKELEILELRLADEKDLVESEKYTVGKLKKELLERQNLFNEIELINYPILKQQNESLQNQLEELKEQLHQQNLINEQDKHKINCLLKQKMGPNFEQSILTNELDRAREIFKREKSILEEQKETMEKRLVEEIKNKRVITEQYSQQQDLVEVLTRQLSDSKEYSYKNKTGYMSSRSQNNPLYSGRNIQSQRDLSPHSTNEFRRKISNYDSAANEFQDFDECSLPIDIENLANDAKHKLMSLDEETEQINKAYHEFKNRLANSFSTIGEIQTTLDPALISQSFQSGLKDGRQIKDKANYEEFSLPNLPESNFDPNLSPIVNLRNTQNIFAFGKAHDSTFANIEEARKNISEPNKVYFPERKVDLVEKFEDKLANDSANAEKVFLSYPNTNTGIINPVSTFDEQDGASKSVDSNLSSDDDKSELINLNIKWQQSNVNPGVQNSSTEIKPNIQEIDPVIRGPDEDDEIDPEVKKYMELVKMQKQAQQNSVNYKNSNLYKKDDSDEDSEPIETESKHSVELHSNRKESPNQSESESFW